MIKCKVCGSYAINPHLHGRDSNDLDLCDVCYWRSRAPDPRWGTFHGQTGLLPPKGYYTSED